MLADILIVFGSIIAFSFVLLLMKDLFVARMERAKSSDRNDRNSERKEKPPEKDIKQDPAKDAPHRADMDDSPAAEVAPGGSSGKPRAPAAPKPVDPLDRLFTAILAMIRQFAKQTSVEQSNAFVCAIIVSFLGFGLLASGIILAFVHKGENLELYTTIGGVIAEFISSLFLWIYTRSDRRYGELFGSLNKFESMLMAVNIAERIETGATRDDTYKLIATDIMDKMGVEPEKLARRPKSKKSEKQDQDKPEQPKPSDDATKK